MPQSKNSCQCLPGLKPGTHVTCFFQNRPWQCPPARLCLSLRATSGQMKGTGPDRAGGGVLMERRPCVPESDSWELLNQRALLSGPRLTVATCRTAMSRAWALGPALATGPRMSPQVPLRSWCRPGWMVLPCVLVLIPTELLLRSELH